MSARVDWIEHPSPTLVTCAICGGQDPDCHNCTLLKLMRDDAPHFVLETDGPRWTP